MRGAAEDLRFPAVGADRSDDDVVCATAIEVECNLGATEVGLVDEAGAPQTTFFADGEQKSERGMRQLLMRKFARQRCKDGTARPIVTAEGRLDTVDDLALDEFRLRAGAQRYRIHMRHEHQARRILQLAASGQIDDQVAGLGRQGDTLVSIVEPNGAVPEHHPP